MTRNARHELSSRLIARSERWYRIGDGYVSREVFEDWGQDERRSADDRISRAYRMARKFMVAAFNAA